MSDVTMFTIGGITINDTKIDNRCIDSDDDTCGHLQLINKCVDECDTDIMIFSSHGSVVKSEHVNIIVDKIRKGYAYVSLFGLDCFGINTNIINIIGKIDTTCGELAGYDFKIRAHEANIATYDDISADYKSRLLSRQSCDHTCDYCSGITSFNLKWRIDHNYKLISRTSSGGAVDVIGRSNMLHNFLPTKDTICIKDDMFSGLLKEYRVMKYYPLDISDLHVGTMYNEIVSVLDSEKDCREQFISGLDTTRDIVLVGKGPSLDQRITRASVKRMFDGRISDDFYIVAVNDTWVYCDEYDYIFTRDEMFVIHYLNHNDRKHKIIVSSFLYRIDDSSRSGVVKIPYTFTNKQGVQCLFQVNEKQRLCGKVTKHVPNVLLGIKTYFGGHACIDLFTKLGFNNIKLIGFGGGGATPLVNTPYSIPRARSMVSDMVIHPRRSKRVGEMLTQIYNDCKNETVSITYK